jgi:hypothetical protein
MRKKGLKGVPSEAKAERISRIEREKSLNRIVERAKKAKKHAKKKS